MKIKAWLVIFCVLAMGSFPYADAMTKSEAKKFVKDDLSYYSPSRKATKIRKKTESASLMQCYFGIDPDPETHIINARRLELMGPLKKNDKLVSVNGVVIDWSLEHPIWGSLEKTPIVKGDEISMIVQREGNKVSVEIPCLGDRNEMTEIMEDAAAAFSTYKGKNFLDKWGSSNDCLFSWIIHEVAIISFNKRKIRKTDYNSYAFNLYLCNFNYTSKKLTDYGVVMDSEEIKEFRDYIQDGIDYLLANGSPELARKLEDKLDGLDSYESITQFVSKSEALSEQKTVATDSPESATSNEMINSAFGIKLGTTFKETKVKIGSALGEIPLYRFTPQNPVSVLKNYAVILTPKSDQILEIWAWDKFSNSAGCNVALKQLEAALDRKYLSLKKEYTSGGGALYSEGERTIIANCPVTFGSNYLYLQYKDKAQDDLRVGEKNESEKFQGL